MKKLIYIFMIAAVLVSCKKNAPIEPINDNTKMQEVTFEVNTILGVDREYDVPNCDPRLDTEMDKYAEIVIEDAAGTQTTYFAEIYYVEGLPYTKAIMLPVSDNGCDTYTLREFYVWDNNETPGYDGTPGVSGSGAREDDELFKAAPLHYMDDGVTETPFWKFGVNRVDQTFDVCAFEKTKILIDVLCFIPDDYELFGFFWFEITEITVREICFFGDFCLKDTYIYEGTEYDESDGGVFIDEPAIFKIEGRHLVGDQWEDMVGSPWDNMDWLGVGEPLCIRYADYDAEVDSYEFDLYLWAMVGDGMGWVYLHTFAWTDIFEDTFDPGADGVYEFVVGNCVANETDMLFEPYMNLPQTATMYLRNPAAPGEVTGFYWDVKLYNFDPPGTYDIPETTPAPTEGGNDTDWLGGWCGDQFTTINYGGHDVLIRTTLQDVSTFPTGHKLTNDKCDQLNYLFNNWEPAGLNPLNPGSAENTTTMQESIWGVMHYDDPDNTWMPAGGSLAYSLANAAINNGPGYQVLPGGWAGVLMFEESGRSTYVAQLILIVVDP